MKQIISPAQPKKLSDLYFACPGQCLLCDVRNNILGTSGQSAKETMPARAPPLARPLEDERPAPAVDFFYYSARVKGENLGIELTQPSGRPLELGCRKPGASVLTQPSARPSERCSTNPEGKGGLEGRVIIYAVFAHPLLAGPHCHCDISA